MFDEDLFAEKELYVRDDNLLKSAREIFGDGVTDAFWVDKRRASIKQSMKDQKASGDGLILLHHSGGVIISFGDRAVEFDVSEWGGIGKFKGEIIATDIELCQHTKTRLHHIDASNPRVVRLCLECGEVMEIDQNG